MLKDVNSGNVGVVNTRLAVPRFEDDQLSSSSLILADHIQRVSTKDIGVGTICPGRCESAAQAGPDLLTPADSMGVFLQVYNLKVDDKTHKPDASVEITVVTKNKDTEPTLKFDDPCEPAPAHGEEMTLENMLTVGSLHPEIQTGNRDHG